MVVAAAAGPLVTGTIQNRRDARLVADLDRNWKLLAELKAGQPDQWTHEIAQLDALVRTQVAAVASRQTRYAAHRRNWASLGAVCMIVVMAFPLLWLLVIPGAWWSWTLFTALLLVTVILCGIGLYQTFNPPDEPAPESGSGAGQT
ncbi:hypothetical protein ACGFZG_23310 [Streptomyces antibioticus]|uniref:hypothetical protein n=1 Tax=Streptomyces antibioticus TaxID=1890 RepID=UPI00371B4339